MNFIRGILGKTPERKPRSPRIRLLLSDRVRFETAEGSFPILNLSESGLNLLVEKGSLPDNPTGKIYLGAEVVNVDLVIVRRNGNQVGAKFAGEGLEIQAALKRQFLEEFHATEMTEVDPAHLNQENSGKPRWFYAPGNFELFFLEDEAGISRVEIGWSDRVVCATRGEGVKLGLADSVDRSKPAHVKSSLVRWEADIGASDRTKAMRIVENVAGLEAEVRERLLNLLKN